MPVLLLRLLPILSLCFADMARAEADLCDRAAMRAASETGVPLEVLRSLTRAETGRNRNGVLEPWPWAVNQAGQGYWFDSADAAADFVTAQLDLGVTNLDIGCFQLNHRWHSEGFVSLATMFDPEENAVYAARFLASKYRESGDWVQAAGAYHSGTEEFAGKYEARFREILQDLAPAEIRLADLTGDAPAPRVNAYPLLQAGGTGGTGSLVPRTDGMGSLFARVR
ncbi:transglycosylase SLT domain-containing protein [Gemmobacter serpentinus]|uniref:transglycosylase SLT domain-containing protein n=1 Tax=Gemmobacter serpentinus TaxID=2652247 RepID=UPI001CF719BB|nr:transglycosylase SLT domain-containing protein [Gemmobacter serpentinus]